MEQLDVQETPYTLEVRWAPMQELVVSLEAFLATSGRSTMDMGAAWERDARHSLTADFGEWLRRVGHLPMGMLGVLALQADAPGTARDFCAWAETLSVGEMYQRFASMHAADVMELPSDLAGVRDDALRLVRCWDQQYFQGIDPAILDGLAAEAARLSALLPARNPVGLVEEVTAGVRFLPQDPVDVVLLIPQYHYRPWNIHGRFGAMQLFRYPADVLPAAPGEPPLALLRATRALSDGSRLRILRHLTAGSYTFTELVRMMGLSKSTVHHHLVILRAAGLVRLEHRDDAGMIYSLRAGAEQHVADRLHTYLTQEG